MPEPKNRAKNRPPEHEHPALHCYKKWGAEGCGRPHDHEACRELAITYQREQRQKTNPNRGAPSATRRKVRTLSEDEVARLRKQVGLI